MGTPRIEVRRGADRAVTEAEGRRTAHSFAFGAHYDPANVGFGLLVAHNDERLPAGGGYPDHPHTDLEIVTVVLDGVLRHRSGAGSGLIGAGGVQRLSAGRGVVHAETSDDGPVRFVQTWLRPDRPGGDPSYARAEAVAAGPGLVPLVGGEADLGVGASARLYLLTAGPGGSVALPDAPRLHLFVVEGGLDLGEVRVGPDDAARITAGGAPAAASPHGVRALVWAMR